MSPKALSRILAVKERLRQLKRSELAEANAEVHSAEHQVALREGLRTEAARAVGCQGDVAGGELQNRAELFAVARSDHAKATKVLNERNVERDVCKEAVVDATRDMRVIETLRERSVAIVEKEQATREQTELDEISSHTQTRRAL